MNLTELIAELETLKAALPDEAQAAWAADHDWEWEPEPTAYLHPVLSRTLSA